VCTRVFQGQPVYVLEKKKFPRTYATMSKIAYVHPQKHGKNKNERANSPLNFHGT
jgi:hypothetical protein